MVLFSKKVFADDSRLAVTRTRSRRRGLDQICLVASENQALFHPNPVHQPAIAD
jgi:hypothetical protein